MNFKEIITLNGPLSYILISEPVIISLLILTIKKICLLVALDPVTGHEFHKSRRGPFFIIHWLKLRLQIQDKRKKIYFKELH